MKKLSLIMLALMPAFALADDHKVIVAEGTPLPKVKVGDVIRISQSAPSGKSEITATSEKGAKLVSTTEVDVYVNGQKKIGALTKEFEFKAEKVGKAKIKITVKDTITMKSETMEYDLTIE